MTTLPLFFPFATATAVNENFKTRSPRSFLFDNSFITLHQQQSVIYWNLFRKYRQIYIRIKKVSLPHNPKHKVSSLAHLNQIKAERIVHFLFSTIKQQVASQVHLMLWF